MTEEEKNKTDDQPLDDLLSLRGKPFADWKEERIYLREKWGEQGREIEPGPLKKEEPGMKLAKEDEQG